MPARHVRLGVVKPPVAASESYGATSSPSMRRNAQAAADEFRRQPKERFHPARSRMSKGARRIVHEPPEILRFPDEDKTGWQKKVWEAISRMEPSQQLWELPTCPTGCPENVLYGGNNNNGVGPYTSPKDMHFFYYPDQQMSGELELPRLEHPEATGLMYVKLVDNYAGRQFTHHGELRDVLKHDPEDCKAIIDQMTTEKMVEHYGFVDDRLRSHKNGYRPPPPMQPEPEPDLVPEPEPEPVTEEVVALLDDLITKVVTNVVPQVLALVKSYHKSSPKSPLSPSSRAFKAARSAAGSSGMHRVHDSCVRMSDPHDVDDAEEAATFKTRVEEARHATAASLHASTSAAAATAAAATASAARAAEMRAVLRRELARGTVVDN